MLTRSTRTPVVLFALIVTGAVGFEACAPYRPWGPLQADSAYVNRKPMPVTAKQAPASTGQEFIAPPLPIETASIETWSTRFPDASRGLAEWRLMDEYASERILSWDAAHPDSLRILVLWAVTHPHENAGAFLFDRTHWDAFAEIERANPASVEAFLHWVRRSAPAAEELVTHPAPLSSLAANRPAR